MGCDIHSIAEIKTTKGWLPLESDGRTSSWGSFFERNTQYFEPFNWRSYAIFGFLADVRNYSHCEPISEPRGLPTDSEHLNSPSPYAYDTSPMSGETIPESEKETIKSDLLDGGYHSYSWLLLKELTDFDYEKTFWDRRVTKQTAPNCWNGAALAEEGDGQTITYREHLGEDYFKDLELLKSFGEPDNIRIVFWFDN